MRSQPHAWLGCGGNLGPAKSWSCGEHELWRLKLAGDGFTQDNSCASFRAFSMVSRGDRWLEFFSVELRGGVGRTPKHQVSRGGPRTPDVPQLRVWGFGELTLSSGSMLQAEMSQSRSSFSS